VLFADTFVPASSGVLTYISTFRAPNSLELGLDENHRPSTSSVDSCVASASRQFENEDRTRDAPQH
jgi:hypothetical protein